jgi:hypothetical protein
VAEEPSYEDRQLARRLFDFLEDRRVLYEDWNIQVLVDVKSSVIQIRTYLTQILDNNAAGDFLTDSIRKMRGACRRFLTNRQRAELTGSDERIKLSGDLGELRAGFGHEIAALAEYFKLEVQGDLRNVLPPSPE